MNQFVTVIGKVIKVDPLDEVRSKEGKPLSKQDCVIADCGAMCRVVSWEADVGKLKKGKSYRFNRVIVRQYGGVKYLSLSENAEITNDIGDVLSEDENDGEQTESSIAEGEVVAVSSADDYYSCFSCRGKVKTIGSSNLIGQCTKCSVKLKMSRCNKCKSAKIVIAI